MHEQPASIYAVVVDTLRDVQRVERPITSASRICADLGVCDEDLSDLVEELFRHLGYRVPEGTTVLPVAQNYITVANLVSFLAEWQPH